MLTPPYLKENDIIGIVAPARSITEDEIQLAIELFESWGLQVKKGNNLHKTNNQFAGTDIERAEDFQEMMDDPHIKAIICARGGYGTVRIMEHLDFNLFRKNPKWIVGYSDITVLHSFVTQQLGIKTLHATMPLNITPETTNSLSSHLLWKALFGKKLEFSWESNTITRPFEHMSGELTGGNLSVLYSMRGTKYDIVTRDKILFLEDLDEYLYHVDRMMMNLKTGNMLANLKAIVVGGMTDMNDNPKPFGLSAHEIIKNTTLSYHYPVIFDCPVGHMKNNLPLIMGDTVSLERLNEKEIKIRFSG